MDKIPRQCMAQEYLGNITQNLRAAPHLMPKYDWLAKDWDAEWYGQVLRINEDKDWYLTPVRPRIVYFMAAIKDDLGLIGGAGDPKFPHLWLTHSDSLFRPRQWLTHSDSLPRARPG
ncbi:hypothetical protein NQZ68_016917, partial [Dissostichus eleginoides]